MIAFIKMNRSLVTYTLIFLITLPLFGFKFLLSLIGNVLLVIFLVPLLILLLFFLSFNTLKSNVKTCNQCGNLSLGKNETCLNCGADLRDKNSTTFEELNKPSETTIEVKAEEIK